MRVGERPQVYGTPYCLILPEQPLRETLAENYDTRAMFVIAPGEVTPTEQTHACYSEEIRPYNVIHGLYWRLLQRVVNRTQILGFISGTQKGKTHVRHAGYAPQLSDQFLVIGRWSLPLIVFRLRKQQHRK